MRIILGILLAAAPIVVVELYARLRGGNPEVMRKSVHVLAAVASSSLILFCGRTEIATIAAVFTLALIITHRKKLLISIHSVKRKSIGEIMFPVGVGIAALLADSAQAYVAAVLIMGLADTVATLVGKHMKARRWPLLKSPKTIEGTFAFMVVSMAILFALGDNSAAIILGTSIIVAAVEMLSGRGVDNATVPLATVLILR